MFALFRYFIQFVKTCAFSEGELSVSKPTFNPVKIVWVTILVTYLVSVSYAVYKMTNVYHSLETSCPGIVRLFDTPDDIGFSENVVYNSDSGYLLIRCDVTPYH